MNGKFGNRGTCRASKKGGNMDAVGHLKSWIGGLTDIGLMLLGLAIVAALLVGEKLPFFSGVVGNIMGMVNQMGSNGLVGLAVVAPSRQLSRAV
jgi:hypothetical protein